METGSKQYSENAVVNNLFTIGMSLYENERFHDAAGKFSEITIISPQEADAYHMKAICDLNCLLEQGNDSAKTDMNEILHDVQKAIAIQDNVSQYHYTFGLALQYAHEHQAAIAEFNEAIAIDPASKFSHLQLAKVYFQIGEFERALQHYEKVLAFEFDNYEVMEGMALCYAALSDNANAQQYFQSLPEDYPYKPESYIFLGEYCTSKNEIDKGFSYFQKACEYLQHSFEVYSSLFGLYKSLQRPDLNQKLLAKFLQVYGDSVEVLQRSADKLIELQCYDLAVAVYLHISELIDYKVEAYLSLAKLAWHFCDFDEMQRYLSLALADEPENPSAHCLKAALQFHDLQLQDAFAHYRYRHHLQDDTYQKLTAITPVWQGQSLEGKSLLVWHEGNRNHDLMFSTILPELAKRCQRLCVIIDVVNKEYFSDSDNVQFITESNKVKLQDFHYHCPIGDAAEQLRSSVEKFADQQHYLHSPLFTFNTDQSYALKKDRVKLFFNIDESLLSDEEREKITEKCTFLRQQSYIEVVEQQQYADLMVISDSHAAVAYAFAGQACLVLLAENYDWVWMAKEGRSLWFPHCFVMKLQADQDGSDLLSYWRHFS